MLPIIDPRLTPERLNFPTKWQAVIFRNYRMVPDARIATANGKMSKDELSDIWERMIAGDIDVLVSTTIIETGVDVPNANTLIIEDADKFGLSQLHQIRGRVGRSRRRAYAYFTYPKTNSCPKFPKSAFLPSAISPNLVPASALPCVIWKFAARATCWERNNTDRWTLSATICI